MNMRRQYPHDTTNRFDNLHCRARIMIFKHEINKSQQNLHGDVLYEG